MEFGLVILLGTLLSSIITGCAPVDQFIEKPTSSVPLKKSATPESESNVPAGVPPEEGLTPMVELPLPTATNENPDPIAIPTPPPEKLIITILYDNIMNDQRLTTAWGFSALVEYRDHVLLFDTGGDGPILLENMRILGIDPNKIENIVISHAHGDHTGGLTTLLELGIQPTVYLPPSFPSELKKRIEQYTTAVDVSPGLSFAEGMFSTGELGRSIPEQALFIQTERGVVIITGCAHPGIVHIVEQTLTLSNEPVRLVLGGFHLSGKRDDEIRTILADFRRLGVEHAAPSHCTGERAIALFEEEYGEDFIESGVGMVFELSDDSD